MGLSLLVGIKSVAWFFLFAIFSGFGLFALPCLYSSFVSLLVAIASHPSIDLPLLLGKKSDGTFPLWSRIMFSPYLQFVRVFSILRRTLSGEPPYSEICEGLYVGGWPSSPDKMPPGNPAIIDCTCEFPRILVYPGQAYWCIPIWDTRAPRPADIETAVRWACRKRAQRIPVFIHCAYGHGRSVTVMCALLVALGLAEDWKGAEKLIREKRPRIRMNVLHRKALNEWSKNRLSPPKKDIGVSSMIVPDASKRSCPDKR